MMSFQGVNLNAMFFCQLSRVRYRIETRRLAFYGLSLLLLAGSLALIPGSETLAQTRHRDLLAAAGSAATVQAQGMAGYVLNAETNMNTNYTRKFNRELLDPNHSKIDDSPVIQYQGPPPQVPPSGPFWQKPIAP